MYLICLSAYTDENAIEQEERDEIKRIVIELVDLLQDAINKPNFWRGRNAEIRKLHGKIDDLLDFSGVDAIATVHQKLSSEIMSLAKRRHNELLSEE